VDDCADTFARDRLDDGALALSAVVDQVLAADGWVAQTPAHQAAILRECAVRLHQYRASRQEYVLLALHSLHALSTNGS
jgi:hypothetical protein